ncbi:MAG: hypothetical protein JOZ39_00370 [Chloroflexi bacterium]|nr:hypothetical protein [Chloroflexota bacterium]
MAAADPLAEAAPVAAEDELADVDAAADEAEAAAADEAGRAEALAPLAPALAAAEADGDTAAAAGLDAGTLVAGAAVPPQAASTVSKPAANK